MRARLRRWLSEPLVAFAGLAAVLSLGDRALRHERPLAPTEAEVAALTRDFERRTGAPPSAAEVDGLVRAWTDEELLVREAIRLGLDRGDPVVRRRLAEKLRALYRARASRAPTDDELAAWLDAHPTRYAFPARIGFEQVYVGDADPAPVRDALAAGADPAGLGTAFARGRVEPLLGVDAIDRSYGPGFAAQLDAQPDGAWEIATSRFGTHVVRVTARRAAAIPTVDGLRATLEVDWREDQGDRQGQLALEALRGGR